MSQSYGRIRTRTLALASLVLWAPLWIDWWFSRSALAGIPYPWWVAGLLALNVIATRHLPRAKRAAVRVLQRYAINPVVRASLRVGVPLGWALLETRGRRTGRTRSVPVGNGRIGDTFWLIAEHGRRAGYVNNLRADPRVRLKLRGPGLRMVRMDGIAQIRDDLDPVLVQRHIGGLRHPVRALNAMTVRVLGTRLLVVRIELRGTDGAPQDSASLPDGAVGDAAGPENYGPEVGVEERRGEADGLAA